MRTSVDAGALQLALNVLERGTPVQREVAQELRATADTYEYQWYKQVDIPTHSGVYWAEFVNVEGGEDKVEGFLRMDIVSRQGIRQIDVPPKGIRHEQYCWEAMRRYHRIPHQLYEEPTVLGEGQSSINWD
jgi:hypothetical protein